MKANEAVKELAAQTLCMVGVPALARRRLRGRLGILMYHGVAADPLSPPCPYVVDAATLRRQLEFVRRHFQVLPLEDALEQLLAGTLPDRAAALTFDDGAHNISTHAAPILRELGLPAAVFLATGPMGTGEALWADQLWMSFAQTKLRQVDLAAVGLGTFALRTDAERSVAWQAATAHMKRLPDEERLARVEWLVGTLGPKLDAAGGPFQLLSWDEAHGLAKDGLVTLHPHSVTHPILSRCPDEKVDHEISESCATVERETGRAPAIFAYPNGGLDDFDERATAALRRNDIRWALSTTRGFAQRDSDPFAVPRIGIASDMSFARFQINVSGTRPWPRSAQTLVTEVRRRRTGQAVIRRLIGLAATAVETAQGEPSWITYDPPLGCWLRRTRGGTTLMTRPRGMSAEECEDWVRDVFMHRYVVRRGDTVLDIGAGIGTEVLPASRMVGLSGKIVAVEPHPATFAALERLRQLNRLKNVELMQVAVTDSNGSVMLSDLPPEHSIKNRLVASGIEVPGVTLTDLVSKFNLERIDFLRMNIEGAELAALRAASDVLPLVRNAAIACHDFMAESTGDESYRTKDAVRAILVDAGFNVTGREEDPRPWAADYLFASREVWPHISSSG